jgi:hypothetical protein
MTAKNVAAKMMLQMAILTVLYSVALLLTAVKFLPDDRLVNALPYPQVSAMSNMLLELALLSGLIGAAVYAAVEGESVQLKWAFRAWTLFLLVTCIAGALDLLEGRNLLEIPRLLDLVLIGLLIAFMVLVAQGSSIEAGQGKYVWLVGIGFVLAAYVVSFIPVTSILVDRVLRVLTVQMRFNVGYVLAGLAVIYWFPRQMNIYLTGGIAAVMGTLVSFSPLTAIGQSRLADWLVILVLVIGWILLIRELTHPGNAPQRCVTLGLLLLTFSLGLLGSLSSIQRIAAYTQGTLFSTVQLQLIMLSILIILIGFARQSMTNTPSALGFWLTTLGIVGGSLALLMAAGVQTVMERALSIGYLDVQNALVPFYVLWIISLLVMGIGFVWILLTTTFTEN